MTTVADRLIPTAYHLATKCASDMAQQDQFAALHLDTEQSEKFLAICRDVRQCKRSAGQKLLDDVAAIIERK